MKIFLSEQIRFCMKYFVRLFICWSRDGRKYKTSLLTSHEIEIGKLEIGKPIVFLDPIMKTFLVCSY